MTAEEINARLEEAKRRKCKVYPVRNLRASNIGHPCERYLFLLLTRWEEQEPHGPGLQCIFDLGNYLEAYTIDTLKEAGFEVLTPTVRSWRVDKPLITGREDVRIKAEDGQLLPVEIKGLSPMEWGRLNCVEDFFRSKRHYVRGYPAQLHVYMWHFAKDKGYFALTNKLTGETKAIEVPFNFEYADSLIKKAERIYKAVETGEAPEATDDPAVCEDCPLRMACGQARTQEADIDADGELEDLINRRQALASARREYEELDREIKARVGERPRIVTASWLITRTKVERKAYEVKARTDWQVRIKRL